MENPLISTSKLFQIRGFSETFRIHLNFTFTFTFTFSFTFYILQYISAHKIVKNYVLNISHDLRDKR